MTSINVCVYINYGKRACTGELHNVFVKVQHGFVFHESFIYLVLHCQTVAFSGKYNNLTHLLPQVVPGG